MLPAVCLKMNASSKPFALSFSTSFFAFSCFLEAKTWIVYAASSVVAADGFVIAGSSAASGGVGGSTMEVSDLALQVFLAYVFLLW